MTGVAEFHGMVIDGKLPRDVSEKIAALIRSMNGKKLVITFKEMKKRRSLSQNAYMFGYVIPPIVQMFRDAGNYVDSDDVHAFLKQHVGKLSQVIVTPDGEVLRSLGSTAKLSTMEFEAYLEQVRAWAAEHGVPIDLPNEGLVK